MRSPSTRAFLALALSVASLALLQNLVIPVIPLMQSDLGITADAASWTMTAWLIAAAVATPVLGRVGDLRGRRATFLAVLVVIVIGDIVAFNASSIGILLVGRVLQGVGGALFPLAFGLIRDTVPPRRVTGAIGAMSAIIGIGGAAGSVLAGPLSEAVGWRGLFLVPLVLSVVGILLTVAWVPRTSAKATGSLNVLSAVLLSGWLVALLIPLTSGARWGWTSPAVVSLLAIAVVLFAAWVVAELRAKEPLVDIRMLLDRAIWPTNAAAFLVGAAAFGFWGYLPQFVETASASGWGLGLDARAAGLVLLPLLIGMSAMGFATGALSRVLPLRVQLALGAAVMGIAVMSAVVLHTEVWQLALAGGLFGIGIGASYAAAASIIVQSVSADRVGVATGVNANLRTIGSAFGSALTSALVFGTLDASGSPLESGYDIAWLTMAALALAAAVIVLATMRRRRSEVGMPGRRIDERELVAAEA
ncbi:MFS transporter [Microbacterium sp. B2969]|uniref:MFS transporter n=1 Tax=Microbacterium alkaliflavum TaxID=3248839 RepID=A0ABW7Q6C5_9MICO